MVCMLGAESELVGVSHECDWPEAIARRTASGELPVLTSARIGPPLTSRAIHDAVEEAARDAVSVYHVDAQRLAELEPDIIITQDLCNVCAVSYEDVCNVMGALAGREVEIVTLHPRCLDDIYSDVARVAHAIGRGDVAQRSVEVMRVQIKTVAEMTATAERPALLTLEWVDPPMIGGLWMAELIKNAGGTALASQRGEPAQIPTREALEALRPDVLLVKPCGYLLEQGIADIPRLMQLVPWDDWPCCRQGEVYICDGHHFFNRPGPRIVDSQKILAAILHPDLFPQFREQFAHTTVRVLADGSTEPWLA
jgi:iron complex transport system substrate-binding protein